MTTQVKSAEKNMAKLKGILRERGVAVIYTKEYEKMSVIQFYADDQYQAFEIADAVSTLHGYRPFGLRGNWTYGSRERPIWEMAFSNSALECE